ncbi:hypothetical protein KUTeg_023825 [Tegillarca granosa]|uniref:Guanylate cyclase domain-containing protein n=1 Tax=Tegillarca granosa TaxID=220873 RepID=A0ABQ9E3P8_TEGGR|nr:hypothetical protein KUTeg_023825 [Tegillarca granosa]
MAIWCPELFRYRAGHNFVSNLEETISMYLFILPVFDNVTILFSDVVGFTNICSQISPMEVVSMLNAMYTIISFKYN